MENELAKVCVWREARGEPVEGQEAVCWVIRNRMKKANKTSFEVVTQYLQFSSMTFHGDSQTAMYPPLTDKVFQAICAMVDLTFILGTGASDPTQGATFYENPSTANSKWFEDSIKNGKLVKTVTIGRHDFYKEV